MNRRIPKVQSAQRDGFSGLNGRVVGVFIISVVVCLALAQGCGGPNSRKVLRFFFDGVPEADTTTTLQSAVEDVRKQRELQRQASIDSLRKLNEFQTHPPYAARECSSCHNMPNKRERVNTMSFTPGEQGEVSSWLALPLESLCFKCHSDKSEQYAEDNGLMIHDPVAAGECVTCHHPHRSRNKSLLLAETARELCLECHDESIPEGEGDHPELEDTDDCTDCHNPHLSEDEYLLE